jgi:Protein of unknown function (DUF3563)
MRNDPLPLDDPGGLGIFDLMAKGLVPPPPPFRPTPYARWDRNDTPAPEGPEQALAPKRGLLGRLGRWFRSRRQRDLEAYLAQSSDVHDLEARIRRLERDPRHPNY